MASKSAALRRATDTKAKPQRRGRPGRPTLSNEHLLDKALDLFLEQGFERTSIEAVAAAAGMAKRTVYIRYGDKETLFRAALERAIEDWILPIEKLRAAETNDLEQTLLNVGRILVANIMNPAGLRLLRITNAESGRMPEIGAFTYERGTERTIVYLADLLRRRIGASHGDARHWREAAIAFLYLVVCGPPTMTAWGMKLEDDEVDAHTVFGVNLFLNGLFPSAPETKKGDLEKENERLRNLLLTAMLENASLKEALAGKGA